MIISFYKYFTSEKQIGGLIFFATMSTSVKATCKLKFMAQIIYCLSGKLTIC